jgi:hypothetical protein
MALKPETALRKRLEALGRHQAMLDALSAFIKGHPKLVGDYSIHQLHGKLGLKFSDYALIVPNWKSSKAVLTLVKSGDDWINTMESDAYYRIERTVAEDVSGMSDEQLENLLDKMYREANPDVDEDEEE